MHYILSDRFSYDPHFKTFYAEASCLGPNFRLAKLYPDAIDMGFVMVSSNTGKEVKFVNCDTEYHEGDLIFWKFESVAQVNSPNISGLKVIIFND